MGEVLIRQEAMRTAVELCGTCCTSSMASHVAINADRPASTTLQRSAWSSQGFAKTAHSTAEHSPHVLRLLLGQRPPLFLLLWWIFSSLDMSSCNDSSVKVMHAHENMQS